MKCIWRKWMMMLTVMILLVSGCSSEEKQNVVFTSASMAMPKIHFPEASGTTIYGGEEADHGVTIDASHTDDGYVMVRYDGDFIAGKKLIIQGPSGMRYTYNLYQTGEYETFPLSDGDGVYDISVFENIEGTKYCKIFNQYLNVELKNEFTPFLFPNQFVNYTADSEAAVLALQLTRGTSDDLEKVETVFQYVVENITYDKQEAQTVTSDYLPDVDEVLKTKKGICFDYAALMTAMLRSQNIPTKLVTGYTGTAYHAWISTYTAETGWIEGMIFFDGTTWRLMDPTFASNSNSSKAIMKYIGDNKNYIEKFLY